MTDDPIFMPIWTVYDHPLDFPDHYVARRFNIVLGAPEAVPTSEVLVSPTLDNLRSLMPPGLVRLPRMAHDEPHIIEVWL